MKGDLHPAALRLMAELQPRTIIRAKRPEDVPHADPGNPFGKRAVLIAGVRYDTVREARKALVMGYQRFYAMLDSGEAKYVK